MSKSVFLETSRLTINKLQKSDFDIVRKHQKDPEVMKFFGGPREDKKINEIFNLGIDHMQKYGFSVGLVYEKDTGDCIGRAGLVHLDFNGPPDVELAIFLLPAYWVKGYAIELGKNLIKYTFEVLNCSRIFGTVDPNNIAACKLAEKIGLTFDKEVFYESLNKNVNYYIKYRNN
ncbi:MAG: GNAT family N-acetyltransferase [Neisseriaceae bacterium]